MAGGKPNAANVRSVVVALDRFGGFAGLDKPHRLAHYLAQLIHESGAFQFDREVWGPTPAQKRYDTRTDLGNTPARDGDGFKYRGRTGIQITGKANVTTFMAWARKLDPSAPDFVTTPDLLNTDPWEGLGPIWYWTKGNPTGKSLNRFADANDIEMVTRRINGGLNGYRERVNAYVRVALYLLDYQLTKGAVALFQEDAGITSDGIAGPETRAALHRRLVDLGMREQPPVRPETSPPSKPIPASPWAAMATLLVTALNRILGRK